MWLGHTVAVWVWESWLMSQCPVDLQGQNHEIASLWIMRWTPVCEGVSAIPRTQEWMWPHQVWTLGPCLLDHSLFWKAPLVSEHHLNTGLIDSHARRLGPRLDIKWFTAEFLSCIIFYISLDCIRLLPALFFRLSPVLCSQDTNFSLWMSLAAYLQTVFLLIWKLWGLALS